MKYFSLKQVIKVQLLFFLETQMDSNVVFEVCKKNIDLTKLNAKNHTICVDGTSCTMKTSILNSIGDYSNTKVQQLSTIRNMDTFFPSMIGYICTGMLSVLCGGPHFNDRSPLNVYEWRLLWKVFNHYLSHAGNVRPTAKTKGIMEQYVEFFNLVRTLPLYIHFRDNLNCLAFIDSNVDRCDMLRMQRGGATDKERSCWEFYTPLQNLMYQTLYPNTVIDMAWFGDTDRNVVVSGVAKFLVFAIQKLQSRQQSIKYAPLVKHTLPTVKSDYTMNNISTHVQRSLGRWGCKKIINGSDSTKTLSEYIPSYLNVSKIYHPGKFFDTDIISKTDSNLSHAPSPNNDDTCKNSNLVLWATVNDMFDKQNQ